MEWEREMTFIGLSKRLLCVCVEGGSEQRKKKQKKRVNFTLAHADQSARSFKYTPTATTFTTINAHTHTHNSRSIELCLEQSGKRNLIQLEWLSLAPSVVQLCSSANNLIARVDDTQQTRPASTWQTKSETSRRRRRLNLCSRQTSWFTLACRTQAQSEGEFVVVVVVVCTSTIDFSSKSASSISSQIKKFELKSHMLMRNSCDFRQCLLSVV